MVGGVTSAAGYQYFLQMKQAQGSKTPASRIFNNLATNGNGSIGKDEFSAFQSALVGRLQDTQSSSQPGSTEFLLSLLQSAGQIGSTNTTTGTTASSTSQQGTVDDIFNEMDANGDGSISKDEFENALSGMHLHHLHGSANASTQVDSSSTADQLFAQIDTNGDCSISKEEMTAFQSTMAAALQSGAVSSTSNSTATQAADASSLTSFIQQAITKYLQLTPGGLIGAAGLGGILAVA